MSTQNPTARRIAGAIYDFAAMLTCRDKPITLGATHDASPAADACQEFLKLRGCDDIEPMVKGWQDFLIPAGEARSDCDTEQAPEQELPQADASIDLRMDKGQMLITIAGPDDHRSNKAVHFAHWVGRNLPALASLARQDLLAQERLMEQATAIAQLVAKPVGPVIEPPSPRLVGADGQLLQ